MRDLAFRTDDEWRKAIAAQAIKIEFAIYDVGFAIILLAIGAFVTERWWEYGLLACAGFASVFLAYSYRTELKDFRRLVNRAQ